MLLRLLRPVFLFFNAVVRRPSFAPSIRDAAGHRFARSTQVSTWLAGVLLAGALLTSALLTDTRPSCIGLSTVSAAEGPSTERDFQRDVRPILADKCYACHGPDATSLQGQLRLDLRDRAVAAAASGRPAIVPGAPDASELIRRIEATNESVRMPPPDAHKQLTAAERATLRQWIASGAKYQEHWAFRPLVSAPMSSVSDARWSASPLDRRIWATLRQRGLTPSPPADRATLLRRLSLDLRGLPPAPEEIAAFVNDDAIDAEERLVERLLASPRFGERLALIWLDLARYGDTNGFHADSDRPVWPWRDWVVEAGNRNLPFDQFSIWQLAGDLLPQATLEQRVASGFNRNVRFNEEGGADPAEFLAAYAADRVITLGRIWFGLTLNCAQCHSHKYDPVTQQEFYELTAFFNSLEEEGAGGVTGFHGKPVPPVLRVPTRPLQDELQAVTRQLADGEREIERLVATVKLVDPGFEGDPAPHVAVSLAAWEESIRRYQPPPAPVPNSRWDFTRSAADSLGERHGTLVGGARLTADGLVLDGQQAHVVTAPLAADIQERTLEAWVKLAHLEQRGGAVLGLQTLDPDPGRQVFDALVYGERQPGQWMAGSDYFRRTADLGGRAETEAHQRFVHLALVYDHDGTIRAYRDGQPYGQPYRQDALVTYQAGAARVIFGARALPPGGNFMLAGTIREARLYERALSAEEVAASAGAAAPPVPEAILALMRRESASRTPEQTAVLRDYYLRHVHGDTVARLAPLRAATTAARQRNDFLRNEQNYPLQMVSVELAEPRPAFVLDRGDFQARGAPVTRRVPRFLPAWSDDLPTNRLGLAQWLFRRDQPLVARVQVNRLWQLLFGEGLVRTPGDFGSQGAFPTHPELLDQLAIHYVDSGWDTKHLLRTIVTSQTYRQSSADARRHADQDPENRLLWRAPRVRLPAELVRDQALAAAGLLSSRIGGPPVFPHQPPDYYQGKNNGWRWNLSAGEERFRRGLYTFWRRTTPYPTFVIFDAPDRAECACERPRTNTPLQALAALNDPQFVEAARGLAERLLRTPGGTTADQIHLAFLCVVSRAPTPTEQTIVRDLLEDQRQQYGAQPQAARALVGEAPLPPGMELADLAAWTATANVLLNLDEAITRN